MNPMKILTICLAIGMAVLMGCTSTPKAPDVAAQIRTALDQAGLKDVSQSQDRDKGVITLKGNVAVEADKTRAESIARTYAGAQVVSNQIAVLPPGSEGEAKKIYSALDNGIESNLEAALIAQRYKDLVKYSVKNGVVTLTGTVDSQEKRAYVQQVAAAVPNVQQVVNEIQVKNQKATSTP